MEILPSVLVGFISSIITEIFKIWPWISATDSRKRIATFLITLVVTVFYLIGQETSPKEYLGFFVLALTTSYGTFKAILQELEETTFLGKLVKASK